MTDWWRAIEAALDLESEDAPDPWADREVGEETGLTDQQVRFLVDLSDQPAVPRLDDLSDDPEDVVGDPDSRTETDPDNG